MRHNLLKRTIAGMLSPLGALALAVACGAGCAARGTMPFQEGDGRYRFEFRLERMAGETGSCAAAVRVRDLEAKRDLAIPLFSVAWGATAEQKAVDAAHGAVLSATVAVADDGVSGRFRAELRRGDLLLASRSAAIPVQVVKPAPRRTYP